VAEHVPSGFSAYTVCNFKVKKDADFSRYATEPVLYSGPDAMNVFYDHINTERRRISRLLGKNVEMMPLTLDEQDYFDSIEACPYCGCDFTESNRKVRHHNHIDGQFIDGICNSCNLQLKSPKRKRWQSLRSRVEPKIDPKDYSNKKTTDDLVDEDTRQDNYNFYIPCFFHGLRNYDSHHLLRFFDKNAVARFKPATGEQEFVDVKITAQNLERMIAVEMYYVRFLDSFQVLSASLETLADNLAKSCDTPYTLFTHTRNHFKNQKISDEKVLFAKGVFPYEYFNSFDKFGETCSPQKTPFIVPLRRRVFRTMIMSVRKTCGRNWIVKLLKITTTTV